MSKTKCQQCYFGACLAGQRGSIYNFSKVIKKDIDINYIDGELGCRKDNWYEKEQICLNNNFSEFREFKEE